MKQDYVKSITYFSAAAQQGHLVAIFYLAQIHHYGLGTVVSCPLAVQLYKKVAERGPWQSTLYQAYELFQVSFL